MRAALPLLSTVVGLASAHFKLDYPSWRGDSLAENTTYDQWSYPCAGAPYGAGNVTEWPVDGGSVVLDLHHPWSYVYINLGLGENVTNFNISLTPDLLNVTGKGTLCLPVLPIPTTIADGQNATIQVVTNGQSGSALYNCADITFRSSAKPLGSDSCTNSTGVAAFLVGQSTTTNSSSTSTPTPNGAVARAFGGASRATALGVVISSVLLSVV